MYQGYIFDCDGTLADTMPQHYESWKSAILKYGFTEEAKFTWEYFITLGGLGLADTVELLNKQFQQTLPVEPLILYKEEHFLRNIHHTKAKPQIWEIAQEAIAKKIPVSIASGSPRETVRLTLEAIGLEKYFPVVVTRDDVTHGKPHPESFLRAAEQMGVPPHTCIVYEDSPLGKQAADAAGMDCVLIDP